MVVAALGDAQIGVPGRRGEDAGAVLGGSVDVAEAGGPVVRHDLLHRLNDVAVAACAQDAVHLRQLREHVLLVPLGHAAGDQNLLHLARLFQLRHLEDVVDGLLIGGGQEAAGVDHHHVGSLGLGDHGVARRRHAGHHLLAVDLVLGTAQGDK